MALVVAETERAAAAGRRAGEGRLRAPAGRQRPAPGHGARRRRWCTKKRGRQRAPPRPDPPRRRGRRLRPGRRDRGGRLRHALRGARLHAARGRHRLHRRRRAASRSTCAAQWPHDDLHQISHMLNLPEDRLREIVPAIGGAFGGREDMFIQHLLALCAFVLRRPVKMVFTREESITRTGKRHPFYFHMRWAADARGPAAGRGHQGHRRRRRLPVHQHPGAQQRRQLLRRALQDPRRPGGRLRGLHQQRRHHGHARLRRHPAALRLRAADGPAWPRSWAWTRWRSACATCWRRATWPSPATPCPPAWA